MTASSLMASLTGRGVILSADGGRLSVDAPAGVLTEDDRDALRRHKAAILAILDGAPPPDDPGPDPASMPWPPRPVELATWPTPYREAWGRRSAELEDAGVPWPESERTAFREVRAAMLAAGPSVELESPAAESPAPLTTPTPSVPASRRTPRPVGPSLTFA